jgi:hypothetical protein
MFRRAIAIDPSYARTAYAGLAEMHCRYFEWSYGDDDVREAADRVSARALEVAPQLPGSHVARGQVHKVFHRYDEARVEFDEAIRISPNDFDAYHLYGRLCFEMGHIEESARLFRRASGCGSRTTRRRCCSRNRSAGSRHDERPASQVSTASSAVALWPDDPRTRARRCRIVRR